MPVNVWGWGANLLLQNNNGPTTIQNCQVRVRSDLGDGITVIHQPRGSFVANNTTIVDNTITYDGGSQGHTGFFWDTGGLDLGTMTVDRNTYLGTNGGTSSRWYIQPSGMSFSRWQGAGFDANGTAS